MGKSTRRKRLSKLLVYQRLESRQLLAGLPIITEFLASNNNGIADDNGDTSDWIEIYNAGNADINLAGYTLTDDADNPNRWTFPSTVLADGEFLLVRASTDAAPNQGAELFTGFGLSSGGEYLGLYDPAGNVVSEFGSDGSNYPTQYSDVSYGVQFNGSFDQVSYFSTPTPGAANTNPVVGVSERVEASVDAGFYEGSIQVSLSTDTLDAIIGYTTDGSTPTFNNVTIYTGPITISSTTNLRAFSARANHLLLPDRTWSYIFLDDVLTQSNNGENPAGFPAEGSVDHALDYGIDPDVIAVEGEQAVKDALLAIPTWSIATDLDNFFDPSDGIYVNSLRDGIEWERPVSLEQLNPDGTEGFQVNAGIRIKGGGSRNTNNAKHSFKFFFRNEYGDSSLEYDLFKGDSTAVTSFEKIDLRTAQNFSWSRGGNPSNAFIRDVLARRNQAALGQQATRSTWVHLYLNGQYWGLYQTQERADANFGASYFGGDAEDYDVIKPERGPYTNFATDGNFVAYERLHQQALARAPDGVTPAFVDNAAYYRAQGLNPDGTDNPNFETLLDVDNLTAYMLVIFHSGNTDGPLIASRGNRLLNNYFAVRDRTGDHGFQFIIHDSEFSYRSLNIDRTGPFNHSNFESDVEYFNPQWLHQQLMANEEYRIQFADKVQESFYNDGGMSVEALVARLDEEATAIDQAIIAESARWGDAAGSILRLRSDWVNAVDNLRDLMTGRHSVVVEQFQNASLVLKDGNSSYTVNVDAPLVSDVDAPVFVINGDPQHGGQVDAGQELQFTSSSEGTVYYTTDGTDPRESGGVVSSTAQAYDGAVTTSTLITANSTWQYEDSGQNIGTAWRNPGFNDSAWASGQGRFGFGDPVITPVNSGPAGDRNLATYFRKEFTSNGVYDTATLSINRDDGVIVYLNGVEVVRDNLPAGDVNFDTTANTAISGNAEDVYVDFVIPASLLVAGVNTIAVGVHQTHSNSSDLLFDAELTVGQLTVGSEVPLDTTTPVLSRTLGLDGTWSALQSAVFTVVGSVAPQSAIRISEINFNPYDPTASEVAAGFTNNDDFEFLELFNSSTTGSVNLAGLQLSDGVAFEFSDFELLPGERAVVVEDVDAFMARYGDSATVLGQWSGALNNGGEKVALSDSFAVEIMSVDYGDNDPWYLPADGHGFSLVLDDPVNTTDAELGKYYSWRSSTEFGGTPGAAPASPIGVVVNEVLAHTDSPQSDSIELFNSTGNSVDVGGWYLSDEGSDLLKYQIPLNTVISAGGYLVFDESDFNPTPATPAANEFALSGSLGDQVYLTRASGGTFVGLEDAVEFDATFSGESLGRLPNGTGRLTRLASNSLGSANGVVEVGPLVISEVNYHPENPNAAALAIEPLLVDNDLEYIEIANPTSATVDLTNWRLRGESDFNFVTGTILPAGGAIVIVPFDPTVETSKLAAFRAHYGISTGVTIVGGLSASLSNNSGRIALQQPDTPDALGEFPNVVVDEVVYDDLAPWPTADGSGQSLERDDLRANGNLRTSWISALPTPGAFESAFLLGDANQDGEVNFLDISPFVSLLSAGGFLDDADVNRDGEVNFLDISPFVSLLSSL